MSDRVVVFLDYQNVYRRARDAFFEHRVDANYCGQVDPLRLAEYLAADSPFERHLHQVRVYRGMPASGRDPRGYGAARKQLSAWDRDPRVHMVTRPLRYPYGWPDTHQLGERPGEKGIDVALAIDFAAMAVRGEYDVGILFSVDTDLKPALEFVSDPSFPARGEVAAWRSETASSRLSLRNGRPYCHWLGISEYNAVCDETDYAH